MALTIAHPLKALVGGGSERPWTPTHSASPPTHNLNLALEQGAIIFWKAVTSKFIADVQFGPVSSISSFVSSMYDPADQEFPGTLLSTGTEDYFESANFFNAGHPPPPWQPNDPANAVFNASDETTSPES